MWYPECDVSVTANFGVLEVSPGADLTGTYGQIGHGGWNAVGAGNGAVTLNVTGGATQIRGGSNDGGSMRQPRRCLPLNRRRVCSPRTRSSTVPFCAGSR